MVFNFKSDTFMLVVWRGIPRSIRWSIWWNSLWLTDFLALPRRGQRFLLEKVSQNDHSSFPLQGREMAGSSNFKLLMRLSHPFQIWDMFHYFNVHLSDIFTALVIAQEKLNVLRKAFNHWCHCKRWGKYLDILELDKLERNHFLTIQLFGCQNNILRKSLSKHDGRIWLGSCFTIAKQICLPTYLNTGHSLCSCEVQSVWKILEDPRKLVYFMKSCWNVYLIVFGPQLAGALIFKLCTLTTWSRE